MSRIFTTVTSGDFGDAIFCMSVLKSVAQVTGPVRLCCIDRSITKPLLSRLHVLAPLIKSQPYIEDCRPLGNEEVHWNASEFRQNYISTQNLAIPHYAHYRGQNLPPINWSMKEPWLMGIEPDPLAHGRIIIHRSPRYHNSHFPWKEIIQFYGPKLLFIGVSSEHQDFCSQFGQVEFKKTYNLMEVAKLVAGSLLFIGNQSSANAIAEAIKHPMIQESSLDRPDCIFRRPNAQHVYDGSCVLPGFGEPDRHIPSKFTEKYNINPVIVPPGMWQYPDLCPCPALPVLAQQLRQKRGGGDMKALEMEVIEYNIHRIPHFFVDNNSRLIFEKFKTAWANADL